MTNFVDYETPLACGCSLKNGRCERHASMMADIHSAWMAGGNDHLWDLSDGYGEPGYIPEQGYDWSGIRDSSIEAIESMYESLVR